MNAITEMFNLLYNSVLMPIYWGLLTIIAGVAAIVFLVNLIKGYRDPDGTDRSQWMSRCAWIVIICLLAGFAPTIINWFLGLSGSAAFTPIS